jgi:hypothetical protein
MIAAFLNIVTHFNYNNKFTLTYVNDKSKINNGLQKPADSEKYSPNTPILLLSYFIIGLYIFFVVVVAIFAYYLETERQDELVTGRKSKSLAARKGSKGLFKWRERFKKWIFLREGVKTKIKFWKKFAPELTLISDLLIPFFIVIGYENPMLQIVPIFMIKVANFVYLLNLQYENLSERYLNLINEMCFSVLLISFLIFSSSDKSHEMSSLGWAVIVIVGGMVLSTIILGSLDVFKALKEKCSKSKKTAVEPKNESDIAKLQAKDPENSKKNADQILVKKDSVKSNVSRQNSVRSIVKKRRKVKENGKIDQNQ